VPGLSEVEDKIRDVAPGWIALAIGLELASCAGYAIAFCMIFYRVPTILAIRTALSEMAFGAVLPVGGAGGIAIGAWVAKAKGGSLRRFMERSAVLFLLTSGINAATLALAGILVGVGVLHAPHHIVAGLLPGLVAAAGVALFWHVPRLAARFALVEDAGRTVRWTHTTAGVVEEAKSEVRHPSWRLLGTIAFLRLRRTLDEPLVLKPERPS
jgi:uncharacterized membrane protein YbhN (UPF0104 family)